MEIVWNEHPSSMFRPVCAPKLLTIPLSVIELSEEEQAKKDYALDNAPGGAEYYHVGKSVKASVSSIIGGVEVFPIQYLR